MSNGWLKQKTIGEWHGRVITRNVDFEFWMVPNAHHLKNENAPAFKVMTKSKLGNAFEVGVAFVKRSKDTTDENGVVEKGFEFYSISIDDPSLAAKLYVTAFPSKEKEGEFDIVWQRPREKNVAA